MLIALFVFQQAITNNRPDLLCCNSISDNSAFLINCTFSCYCPVYCTCRGGGGRKHCSLIDIWFSLDCFVYPL